MNTPTRAAVHHAITELGLAILHTSSVILAEAVHPGFNADDSDDVISKGKLLVSKLRGARLDLENLELQDYL